MTNYCYGNVKELYWFAKCNGQIIPMFGNQFIVLNDNVRQGGDATYFEHVVPWYSYKRSVTNVSIYPFCVSPMSLDDVGCVPTQRMESTVLELDVEYCGKNRYEIVICWTKLNMMRYMSGFAGVVFSC